jgi:hypothetical protein
MKSKLSTALAAGATHGQAAARLTCVGSLFSRRRYAE